VLEVSFTAVEATAADMFNSCFAGANKQGEVEMFQIFQTPPLLLASAVTHHIYTLLSATKSI